jgi:hypothetical protein
MAVDSPEVVVGRKHHQVVADTELREQGVDRPELQPGAAAAVAKLRSVDVIAAIRHQ